MKWIFDGQRPIGTQIVTLIQQAIARGELAPGEWLPSVRDLAAEAAVNPNTMQKALLELESMELLHTARNTGKTVTTDEALIAQTKEKLVRASADAFFEEMKQLGLTADEVRALIERRQA